MSPSTLTNSSGTTVSSAAGMMAPVMIFTHSPAPQVPAQALPAKAVPTTFRLNGALPSWPPSKAKPSMAELSCGGTLMGEMTSSASTRPRASNTPTASVSLTGVTSRLRNSWTWAALSACGS